MKRFLYLSLFSLIIFSCSEYDDDGLPSEPGDISITNPDGTKKVKRTENNINIAMDMGNPMLPSISMGMNIVSDYAQDSYSFISQISNSFEISGMPGMDELPDEVGTTITNTVVNGLTTEIVSSTVVENEESINRTTFDYDANSQIVGMNNYENSELIRSSNITYNLNNAVIETTHYNDEFSNETLTLNFEDNVIISGTLENVNIANPTNFEIVRNGLNITQINFSGNLNGTYTYTYDTGVNYLHNLGSFPEEVRLTAEIAALMHTTYQSNMGTGSLGLNNLEGSMRPLMQMGSNNLTSVSNATGNVYQINYEYDSDNHPISFSESLAENIIDFDSVFAQMRSQLIENLIENGMSPGEAEVIADQTLEMFEDFEMDLSNTTSVGTIEYYE